MAVRTTTLSLGAPRWKRLAEIVRYRELVRNFVIRDLKARYKNSILGFLWSLLNPLLMMLVFTIVFKTLLPNDIPKFPAFLLVGLLPWNWCTVSVGRSVGAIVGNAHLIKKVYFPRELLPISAVLSELMNLLFALIPLAAILLWFQTPITWAYLLLPVVVLIQLTLLCGIALFLSCLNVFFRDTENIVDVLLLAWFFLTPVFYDLPDLAGTWSRVMYIVNPMASLIRAYREILFYGSVPAWDFLARTAVEAVIVFVVGYLFFLRFQRSFGEEI